ncbi:probable LRR receptor-like serine/threonine-protein kinase At3g47570 isoform X5 [Durio zibethinus]|uniref:Probable LRR receptor-like serine/threonine-protein kinase At3g47570 isoform X5 n=1 Tax=Durio zibethinus TaxID=66656 RepID=A0A6P5XW19_DURZI|nr:probable LRR receptor-like serine/threonine-protein kinase At3g47570 isoform X5 [Durio zibethinus]
MVSFQELLKATDGFASANLIGEGCFGRVYRGILDQNQQRNVIAVKVMNLLEQVGSKSFLKECKTLRNVRRRNLVKRISACSGIDFQGNPFKALIYEFMPNRSLEGWLHAPKEANAIEPGEPKILNFPQRLNIAIDVASALDYLHHHCEVPVVHCDLKPSNILLDHDTVAHVGDSGLARFSPKSINNSCGNSTSSLGLKGTVGYAAPSILIVWHWNRGNNKRGHVQLWNTPAGNVHSCGSITSSWG